jgi:hypothetical protein
MDLMIRISEDKVELNEPEDMIRNDRHDCESEIIK